ncbi:MAG: DUF2892 domain-containing protein [Dehalococcoidia bacterium]
MSRNVGTADRLVRVALGIALLAVGLGVVGGTAGTVIAAISAVPFVTAAIGWCPLYSLLGVRTCPLQRV